MNEVIKKNGGWIGLVFLLLVFLGFNYFSDTKIKSEKQEKLEKIVQEHNLRIKSKINSLGYTGLLPEAPDLEENDSTLLGIDSNNNGVRDDVEIEIVDMFGDDKNLVEAFFASNRSSQYYSSLYETNSLTEEKIQEIMDNVEYQVGCRNLYFDKSKYITEFQSGYYASRNISNENYNTQNRKIIAKKIAGMFSGQAHYAKVNEQSCQEYFERTKSFKILR